MFCSLFLKIYSIFSNETVNTVTEERTAGKSKDARQIFFTQTASSTTGMLSHSVFYTTTQKRSLCSEGS